MAADPSVFKNTNADINEQLLTAQQRLAYAQALRGQSLQPIQAPSGQNARISPLAVLAQALNGYNAKDMMQGATHDLATAQSAQANNYVNAVRAANGDDAPAAQPPAQPPTQAPAQASTAGASSPQQLAAVLSSTPQASTPDTFAPAPAPAPAPAASSPAAAGGAPQAAAGPIAPADPRSDAVFRHMSANEQLGLTPTGLAVARAKAVYDYGAPTPEIKNSRDAIIGQLTQNNLRTQNMNDTQKLLDEQSKYAPDSPQAKVIGKILAKNGYIAPHDVAPGGLALDADNKPVAYNPVATPGGIPQFQKVGGIWTAPSVAPQQGAAAVNAGYQGAEQGAKQANTIMTATKPDGSVTTNYGAHVAGLTGPSTTDQAVQKSTADFVVQAPQIAQQSLQARAGLENAMTILDKIGQSGPGTKQKFNMLGYLNSAGIPIEKGDVNGYQSMQKYLANSLNTAVQGTGAANSDTRFESAMHGQPNAENMSPGALRGAIQYVASQHDAAIARSQYISGAYREGQAKGDPNAALAAQQQWSQLYNPKVFEFNRMSPDEKTQFKSSLPPDQRAAFGQQFNAAHDKGWVK